MMATATTITLSPTSTPGSTHVSSLTKPSASKASTLLQQNHDKNHIFFNDDGFHNHIAHQLLAVYALGASPEQLQRGFDQNQSYQKPLKAVNESVLRGLEEGEDEVDVSEVAKTESSGKVEGKWKEYLGQGKYFREFEEYFRQQIVKKGWEVVVKEALFAGTEKSEDLLLRMFGGEYTLHLQPLPTNPSVSDLALLPITFASRGFKLTSNLRILPPNYPPRLRHRIRTTAHHRRSARSRRRARQLDGQASHTVVAGEVHTSHLHGTRLFARAAPTVPRRYHADALSPRIRRQQGPRRRHRPCWTANDRHREEVVGPSIRS